MSPFYLFVYLFGTSASRSLNGHQAATESGPLSLFISIVRPFSDGTETKRPIEKALRRLTTASRQTPAVEDRHIYITLQQSKVKQHAGLDHANQDNRKTC